MGYWVLNLHFEGSVVFLVPCACELKSSSLNVLPSGKRGEAFRSLSPWRVLRDLSLFADFTIYSMHVNHDQVRRSL